MEESHLLGETQYFFKDMRVYHRYLLQEKVTLEESRKEISWGLGLAFIVLPVIYCLLVEHCPTVSGLS